MWMLNLTAGLALALAPPAEGTESPLTKDRLSLQQLEAMVAVPLAKVDAGDLAAGQSAFEAMLARASADEAADLLTAFGVGLYYRSKQEPAGIPDAESQAGGALLHAAVTYLERAVPATVRRLGPDHPEVALALNSYADARWMADGDNPDPSVDRALTEALRIRLAALGAADTETLDGHMRLATLKALPSRTGRQPIRVAEAAALFEAAIAARAQRPQEDYYPTLADLWAGLADAFVMNGLPRQAAALLDRSGPGTLPDGCERGMLRLSIAGLLAEGGYEREASDLFARMTAAEQRCE